MELKAQGRFDMDSLLIYQAMLNTRYKRVYKVVWKYIETDCRYSQKAVMVADMIEDRMTTVALAISVLRIMTPERAPQCDSMPRVGTNSSVGRIVTRRGRDMLLKRIYSVKYDSGEAYYRTEQLDK